MVGEQERRDLALDMVTILPRFGSWAINIRDVETPFGKLGFRQLAILWALRRETIPPDELSPTSLARLQRVRPSVITRALTRLEDGGFIRRDMDHQDRRRITITLTDTGRAASQLVEDIYLREIVDSMDHLDDQTVVTLMHVLPQLEGIIDRLESAGYPAFAAPVHEEAHALPGK